MNIPKSNFSRVPKPANASKPANFSGGWVAVGIVTALMAAIILSAIAISRAVKKKKGPSCSSYDNRPAGCPCETGAQCKNTKCKKNGKCA